jgi:hypothetical protein
MNRFTLGALGSAAALSSVVIAVSGASGDERGAGFPRSGTTVRVSEATSGTQANGRSSAPTLSANGRFVAYESEATNLAPGDIGGVFVHDRRTVRTECVSVASDGAAADGLSWGPSLSSDGRYVAFTSQASNLVAGDTNGVDDTFVRDRRTGRTELVSLANDGTQFESYSRGSAISASGRYIAFLTGSSSGQGEVMLRDRHTGHTTHISTAPDGSPANYSSEAPGISADGRSLVFMSYASNLVPDDTNQTSDIFVYRMATGRISLISLGYSGQSDQYSFLPSISGNGRYVTFVTQATNLVPDHTGFVSDLFVRDTLRGRTALVSVAADGTQADDDTWGSTMDFSGRYIAYYTLASNLVGGDTNDRQDVLVYDQVTHSTRIVSTGIDATYPNAGSYSPSIDAHGRQIAYSSEASNLILDDTNEVEDIFVTTAHR